MAKIRIKDNPLVNPSPSLLCKLGSIAVHADEATEPGGHVHHFDVGAIRALLSDAEVGPWLAAMDRLALLPKKRT